MSINMEMSTAYGDEVSMKKWTYYNDIATCGRNRTK